MLHDIALYKFNIHIHFTALFSAPSWNYLVYVGLAENENDSQAKMGITVYLCL